jgi:hypothetical protein
MTIRLQLGNDQADVAAMADPVDQARVHAPVFAEGLVQIINNFRDYSKVTGLSHHAALALCRVLVV